MTPWRILADDLTGALDTAAAWAGGGREVPVFLDTPGPATEAVQAVATGTRNVAASDLPQQLAQSLDWFTSGGHAFKKVDSLLRGNTCAEVAWLLSSGHFRSVVFAPAFPAQGRFTAQGRHWVAPPHCPEGPRSHEVRDSLLDTFAGLGVRAVAPSEARDSLAHPGHVVVPDVLDEATLATLADLALSPASRDWLWCGSAGLAWALAQQAGAAHPPMPAQAPPSAMSSGVTPLLLTASHHPVLRRQLQHLAQHTASHELVDLVEHEPLSPAEAATRLARRMQAVTATRVRPEALVVVGGDTLLALCRATGVRALCAGASPRAGWGRARLVGGLWDGVICHTRSGAFGGTDDLLALLNHVNCLMEHTT